jgi:arsenate reductase
MTSSPNASRSTVPRQRVLFLCSHNSARSQMAEGLLRAWGRGRFEPHSAGTVATSVRPEAIDVMSELGIDIGSQESKAVTRYDGEAFDYAITVCADANEACPYFPRATNQLHWAFDDPAAAEGSPEERLAIFRRVRDEIASRIRADLLS